MMVWVKIQARDHVVGIDELRDRHHLRATPDMSGTMHSMSSRPRSSEPVSGSVRVGATPRRIGVEADDFFFLAIRPPFENVITLQSGAARPSTGDVERIAFGGDAVSEPWGGRTVSSMTYIPSRMCRRGSPPASGRRRRRNSLGSVGVVISQDGGTDAAVDRSAWKGPNWSHRLSIQWQQDARRAGSVDLEMEA